MIKTPVERLFDNLEGDKISRQIESKEAELQCFNDSVKTPLIRNDGTLPVCGQCHLREGHTKRNCKLGSVKSCGLIDKHPNEKGERRKMESELATLRKNLNKSQENFRMKKKAYSKVKESFVCKVEQDLILSNPDVYVQNGCKNWSLIHKHSAILEQKCKGKLPKRNDIPKLLKALRAIVIKYSIALTAQTKKIFIELNRRNQHLQILRKKHFKIMVLFFQKIRVQISIQ